MPTAPAGVGAARDPDSKIIRDLQALIQKMKVAYGTVGLNHRQMLFVPLFVS
jgi:hypothetical protein